MRIIFVVALFYVASRIVYFAVEIFFRVSTQKDQLNINLFQVFQSFFFLLLLSIFLFHFGRPLRLYALQQHEATTIHIKHFTKHAFNNQSTNVIQGFDTMLRLALIPVNLNVVALSFPFSSFCVPFFCFESLLEIYPIHLTTRAKHYKSNFLNMNRIVPAPISQWFFFFLSFGALIISTQSPTYNDIHNFHSATIYVFCGALYS